MKLICRPNQKAMKIDEPFHGEKIQTRTDRHGDHHALPERQTLVIRRG